MNLRDAGLTLASFLNGLDASGYVSVPYDDGTIRVVLKSEPDGGRYVEVGNPHGYWDVTCSSANTTGASGVVVPREAFDLLVVVAEYTRAGGQTTPLARCAVQALEAAGLLPPPASADEPQANAPERS